MADGSGLDGDRPPQELRAAQDQQMHVRLPETDPLDQGQQRLYHQARLAPSHRAQEPP
jgi:hypothetical protein